MPRFFIEPADIQSDIVSLTGENVAHIVRVLRMRAGEELTLCDGQGMDYSCVLNFVSADAATARILSRTASETEPELFVTLYMALPKGDKMDLVVQKSTELGVSAIVPYFSARCVSKPDEKTIQKKTARWQKIAAEAAKQCGRGRIPVVYPAILFSEAVELAKNTEMPLFLYEGERGRSIKEALSARSFQTASLMVGPEGGFEEAEAELASTLGLASVSIGKRILRCETAPLAGLSALMYHSGNF